MALQQYTYSAKPQEIQHDWIIIDAEDLVLGRLSAIVATRLRGKHKVNYTPHVDCGDNVIVINSKKINLTGKKWEQKKYIRYTGYPGGQRSLNATEQFEKNPNSIIEKSVKGMLPKNKLGADLFRNLHVFADSDHKFEAQKPSSIDLNKVN